MKARKVKEVERSESRARRRTSMQADARQYIEMYIHASSLNIRENTQPPLLDINTNAKHANTTTIITLTLQR